MKGLGSLAILGTACLPFLFVASQAANPQAPADNKTTLAAKKWTAVQSISRAHCNSCHSGATPSAGLDLTKPSGWTKLAIPQNSDKSVILRRVKGLDGKPAMPMGFAPLSAAKIAAVADWIDSGAAIAELPEKHWAYQPIRRPKVPAVPGVTNPIDAFIRVKLKEKGLSPAAPASNETLTRRLYLDITGLPPEPGQTADIDALLASPQYGEKQAQYWLDLARYADSDGFEKDLNRPHMWRYRDWVIDAFNRDLPYDRFTVEQLAGDRLPSPTLEQRVATAFNRNTMFNTEGGVDPAESMYQTIIDRVSTTSTVWLGSSMACARCHDHKYDPFTQRDFFRMYAAFGRPKFRRNGDIKVAGETWIEPEIKAPSRYAPEQNPSLMVMEDDETKALRAPIHHRGEFLSPRETVPSGTPHFLPPPKNPNVDRLELARWITDVKNPLTARVQVNRMWAQVFGRGIVVTLEDFGTQGAKPTHPELLDYLASELIQSEWDLKHIWRLIYSSQTYRQSSDVSAAKYKADPTNEWYSRGARFRLDAETIRDQALAVSGLLSKKIGGPSVMPPQPDGIWQTPYNGEDWKTSGGEDRYRRGLYTFIKRSAPYPSFVALDATSRESCIVRRSRTNTPLQSLALLNDPVMVEAGAALAKRMMSAPDPAQGISMGFSLCTNRRPSAGETARLQRLLQQFPDRQKGFETVASVLLNLDETVTRS